MDRLLIFKIMVWRKVLEFGKYDTFHPVENENKGIDGLEKSMKKLCFIFLYS